MTTELDKIREKYNLDHQDGRLDFKLPDNMKTDFKSYCKRVGISMTDELHNLILSRLNRKEELINVVQEFEDISQFQPDLSKLKMDLATPDSLIINNENFRECPIVEISTRRQSTKELGEGSSELSSDTELALDLTGQNSTSAVKGDQWLKYYQVCSWIDNKAHSIRVVRFDISGEDTRTLRGSANLWIGLYMATENPFKFKVEIVGLSDKLKSVESTLSQNAKINFGRLTKTQEEKELSYSDWIAYRKHAISYIDNNLNGQLQPLEKYLAQYDKLIWDKDLDEIANKNVYIAYKEERNSGSRIAQLEKENQELKQLLREFLNKMDRED